MITSRYNRFTLRLCTLAALIATMVLFAQPAQVRADAVLRGYWTFDYDTVDSGVITESSYYAGYGTHNGILVNQVDAETGAEIPGISFNTIVGEPGYNLGNYGNTGNYISFTNDSYAVIDHTGDLVQSDCQRSFDFNGAPFTISAWVKGLPSDVWRPYIAKNGEGYGYQLRRHSDTVNPTITYRLSDGDDDPAPNIAGANTNLDDGGWHHLVAVYGGMYRDLYMDGQLVMHITDSATNPGGTGEPLVFSARYTDSYNGFANISLDDVAIYSGALKTNQIAYLSQGGDPLYLPSETKTYNIPLNSPTADDGITLNRNGNISRHWLDGDIHFDGNSYIRTNLPVALAGMNGSFTASAWVKLDGDSLAGDRSIFGNNATGENVGLHLIVRDGHPHMGFYSNDLQASNVNLNTGEWYYLTWQYDAPNQTQRIYLGGEEIASRTGAAAFAGLNVLDLGTSMGGGYLNGNLKGISITDAVLTAEEIQYQMNNPDTRRIENFEWGKNDEWYTGGGASLGNLREYNNEYGHYRVISMFNPPATDEEKTIYSDQSTKIGDADNTTGMIWGPHFTVALDAPADSVFSFNAMGGSTPLDVTSRAGGGAGVALWDLTTGDYVRDD
ncbi:MAG: LamG domain-containing protein, partial [Thermoguttaceae bacterium]|nr:LamG domain-containing protein [Thermoguttaceae bacterium]